MVKRVIKVSGEVPSDAVDGDGLAPAFAALRQRLELPEAFPADAEHDDPGLQFSGLRLDQRE